MNIKKMSKFFVILLIIVIASVSIAKYFNISTCCQPTSCSSIPIYQDACSTETSSTVSHHFNMINNLTISIFNQSITLNVLNLSILLVLFSTILYKLKHFLKYKEKSKYLSLKQLFKKLGNHIHSFDELRVLFSKGIIGSKKQFA